MQNVFTMTSTRQAPNQQSGLFNTPVETAATQRFEAAWATVGALCDRFGSYQEQYFNPRYQEADVRKDFIDKLLIALGWDVNNERQPNPALREVRVERGVNTNQGKKKADYALFIAPDFKRERLFIEAKKPSAPLATANNYFQAIRYGWHQGHPIAVLTNFAELHIIDCRAKPKDSLNNR